MRTTLRALLVLPLLLLGCGGSGGTVDLAMQPDLAVCPSGTVPCGAACVRTQTDNSNCGSCGTVCPAGNVCSAGTCALSCQQGLTNCSGTCASTQTDNSNCGSCGTACPAGNVCSAGTCALSCQQGLTNCSGTCADTQTDNAHCGTCGRVCPAGTMCSGGTCSTTCRLPLIACNQMCIDPRSDPSNCGVCSKVCPTEPNADAVCDDKTCSVACNTDFLDCDHNAANGCEVNWKTDVNNCGGCGNACGPTGVCASGVCMVTHNDGFNDTWVDSAPLGTYNGVEASAACRAYSSAHGLDPAKCYASACTLGGAYSADADTDHAWFYTVTSGSVTAGCCGCGAVASWK